MPIASAALVALVWWTLRRLPLEGDRLAWLPFVATSALFSLGFAGMAYSFYPFVVPEAITIYERLLKMGKGLGSDVRIAPTKTYVPLYRRYQFAQIKPTTNSRIDLMLSLRDVPARGRDLCAAEPNWPWN
ncbi:MAG: cytochrome d ubiquinol oxidase subunit II [Pleurocapsa sp. SU_196_0]|nr:cytochrome d ubiquinol oxidase subunit II [Pleurocapsa sp. SU_196_0]